MSDENLLSNRKASLIFFYLVQHPSGCAALGRQAHMSEPECRRLLELMRRAGLVSQEGRKFRVDWMQFVPLFLRHAMQVLPLAMPWRYIPALIGKGDKNFIEAACAMAEREMARLKVKLAGNDLFTRLVQEYFEILVQRTWAPKDYLEDLRLMDAIQEFEIALLKLYPLMRGAKNRGREARELLRVFSLWYRALQGYDTPAGSALREAFGRQKLLKG